MESSRWKSQYRPMKWGARLLGLTLLTDQYRLLRYCMEMESENKWTYPWNNNLFIHLTFYRNWRSSLFLRTSPHSTQISSIWTGLIKKTPVLIFRIIKKPELFSSWHIGHLCVWFMKRTGSYYLTKLQPLKRWGDCLSLLRVARLIIWAPPESPISCLLQQIWLTARKSLKGHDIWALPTAP